MPLNIYTCLLRLVAPLLWAYMYLRARRAGGDWQIFSAERFGSYALPWDGESPVWVHAVSLGETRAAQTLIRQFIDRGERVLLTHMTATGRAEGARVAAPAPTTQTASTRAGDAATADAPTKCHGGGGGRVPKAE